MSAEQRIAGLARAAYAAAIDDDLWMPWTTEVGRLLGGACSVFSVVDLQTAQLCAQNIEIDDQPALDRYFAEGVDRLDPQMHLVARIAGPCVYADAETRDLSHPGTRDYTRWMRDNADLRHYLSAVTLVGDGRYLVAASIHLQSAKGPVEDGQRRILRALLPHLDGALHLGLLHRDKMTSAFWNGIDRAVDEPALLLDDAGHVIRTTPACEALLRAADGLDVSGGRLRGPTPADTERLAAAAAGATAPRGAAAQAMRVARPSGRAAYVLGFYPLDRGRALVPGTEPAALVTIVDPVVGVAAGGGLRARAFGLTGREDQIATLLMGRHSIETAAATLGIAVPTARVHLRRLFAKTGTSRQIDLVRLLARVPDRR